MNPTIDTGFMLALRYRAPVISLETACADFMPHLSIEVARRRAKVQTLPFPVFQADKSQKTTFFVNVSDLAAWLESSREQAAETWMKMHNMKTEK
ncbi:pyocin activator PrtN family protein [Eikenella halliae]|uniref:Pyocin activator protein PrtN n=1 Tax=Eikenella halliae TaxID=1795832 RepID=A0A1B6W051_9NEIS|nr:pyocin activator PrtN family protein [Eikenella halliae]OAM43875.1 hypothetical protein A7Q00_03555 [Eikenella halliae]